MSDGGAVSQLKACNHESINEFEISKFCIFEYENGAFSKKPDRSPPLLIWRLPIMESLQTGEVDIILATTHNLLKCN